MSKRKKKPTTNKKARPVEATPRTMQIRLANIARKLGTNVPDLLESYGDADTIIEKFDTGSLSLLTEDEIDSTEDESVSIRELSNK